MPSSALVRDGAARGRRPPLRRAADEGVRRGLGARAARDREDRLPPGLADGLPAAAERRLGARRVPPRRAPGRYPAVKRARRGSVRAPAQDAAELARARRLRVPRATRPPRSRPSADPPSTRAEELAPDEFVALPRRSRETRARAGEAQPRARRRPEARRRQARGNDGAPADRPRRPGRARARRRARASTASPGTRSCRGAQRARRRAPASSRAGAATIAKRIPSPPGLGGGSSDAATALRLANETLAEPLAPADCRRSPRGLGADVPFFLPRAAARQGRRLDAPAARSAAGLLGRARPSRGARRPRRAPSTRRSTSATAPRATRSGAPRSSTRSPRVRRAARPRRAAAERPRLVAARRRAARLGAFRADVTGAGPAVYGLFSRRRGGGRTPPAARSSASLADGACLVRLSADGAPGRRPRHDRAGRWLRERRLRLALWIAVVEGLLVVFDVIPGWPALVVGALVVVFYVFVGRSSGRHGRAGELDRGDVAGVRRARPDRCFRSRHARVIALALALLLARRSAARASCCSSPEVGR